MSKRYTDAEIAHMRAENEGSVQPDDRLRRLYDQVDALKARLAESEKERDAACDVALSQADRSGEALERQRRKGIVHANNENAKLLSEIDAAADAALARVETAEAALADLHDEVALHFDPPEGRRKTWPLSLHLAHLAAGDAIRGDTNTNTEGGVVRATKAREKPDTDSHGTGGSAGIPPSTTDTDQRQDCAMDKVRKALEHYSRATGFTRSLGGVVTNDNGGMARDALAALDASKCDDCGGTGVVEGVVKGTIDPRPEDFREYPCPSCGPAEPAKPCPVSGACSCGDEAGFSRGACTRCGGWYSAGGDMEPTKPDPVAEAREVEMLRDLLARALVYVPFLDADLREGIGAALAEGGSDAE